VQAWDRYAYVNNNPVRYNDPSGHWVETAFDVVSLGFTINDIRNEGFTFWNTVSLVTDVASIILPVIPVVLSHTIRAGKTANKIADAVDTASDLYKAANNLPISNPIPDRLARVIPAKYTIDVYQSLLSLRPA
jgi:pyocin large subunit-like protein